MAWGKRFKLIIGSGAEAITAEFNDNFLPILSTLATLSAPDVAVSEGSAVDLTGLTIGFRIKRSNKFADNSCELNIANISKETIAKFIGLEDSSLTIEAGYDDEGTALIFTGFVTSAVPEWNGPDRFLNVVAKTIRAKGYSAKDNKVKTEVTVDGKTRKRNVGLSLEVVLGRERKKVFSTTYMNMSYGPNSKLLDIATALATNLGLVLNVFGDISSLTRPNGYNYVGRVNGIIKDLSDFLLSEGYGLTVSLSEMAIYKLYDTGSFLDVPALSYDTGLLKIGPVQNYEVDPHQIEAFPPKLVWEVETILNPKLVPNSIVQIKADALDGFFLIETVEYHGDTAEGEFNCTMVVSKQ